MSDGGFDRRTFLKTGASCLGSAGISVGATAASTGTSQQDPTEIEDWYDLDAVREGLEDDYVLVNNLNEATAGYDDLVGTPEKGWELIGGAYNPFTGTFDGNGYEIADLRIDRPGEDYVGLFSDVGNGGTITNVSFARVDITGGFVVGSIVGDNDGEIIDSSVSGTVTGEDNVGGLVGDSGGKAVNSSSSCDVSGDKRIGGLVGVNRDEIVQSSASGNITGNTDVGGLVGDNYRGEIERSSASGEVTGNPDSERVGGLAGSNAASVTESFSSGDVIGHEDAGGLIGANYNGVGGFAEVVDAVASNNVTGDESVGGIIGRNGQEASVSKTFAVGSVSGERDVGGLIGLLGDRFLDPDEESILKDSYYDTQATNQSDAVGTIGEGDGTPELRGTVTGLGTNEMQGRSAKRNMEALDFGETWTTQTAPDDYPILQWQLLPLIPYTNDEGFVETGGLRDAVSDWRGGEIETETLQEVIDAWSSGARVN